MMEILPPTNVMMFSKEFYRGSYTGYRIKHWGNKNNMGILGSVFQFIDESHRSRGYYGHKQWLENDNNQSFSTDHFYMETVEEERNIIEIGDEAPDRHPFMIWKANLAQLIETWEDLTKRDADEIIIECDEYHHCTMRGEFSPKIIFMKEESRKKTPQQVLFSRLYKNYGYQMIEHTSETNIKTLVTFLEKIIYPKALINWLRTDPSERYVAGSICYTEAISDDRVKIDYLIYKNTPREFTITKSNLITLVEQWSDCVEREVSKIIIECDDDNNCTIQGEFEPRILLHKE